jgi:hypothetical protein
MLGGAQPVGSENSPASTHRPGSPVDFRNRPAHYSCGAELLRRELEAPGGHMTVTIYHNPACGTSRNTLAMIRERGVEPTVIEYLKTPPSRERLVALLRKMKMTPRQLLRERGYAIRRTRARRSEMER